MPRRQKRPSADAPVSGRVQSVRADPVSPAEIPPSTSLLGRLAAAMLIVIVVAVGAATLLGFAGRLAWVFELSSHFRVQYFWLLAGSAVGLALCKRRRWALAGSLLALGNLATIVPLYFGPAPATAGTSLRAMALNVHWLNEDYAATLDLVERERPDFMLFTEVTPRWADALRFLASEYHYWRCVPRNDSAGIALYSRIPIMSSEVKQVGDIGGPTIVAELGVSGGSLTLIGTHPPSPVSAHSLELRNHQLAALAQLARQRHGPLMLLGDLNTTGWSVYFHDLLSHSGLLDTRRGFGVEGSWPAAPLPLRIPIDHCLVSSEIGVANRWIGPNVGSDHRPVFVDFVLPAE